MGVFVAGGTLPVGAWSYLRRPADDALLAALSAGRLAYVLDARQVGKSSLLASTAGRLREQGIVPVRIDLQRIGLNVTVDQWYGTMLSVVMEELGHTEEAIAQWTGRTDRGPLNRWFAILEEVYLPRLTHRAVIFVDEIDFVLGLPFSTDEFFAGLRDWMSRIGGDRITFCLAGVASPQDLIAQGDVTPFNIGERIVLTDFSRADLEQYAEEAGESSPQIPLIPPSGTFSLQGRREGDPPFGPEEERCRAGERDGDPPTPLRLSRSTIDRIHHWTQGHPYLTQRLCLSLIESPGDVDARVRQLFGGATGRTDETHLADVARRLAETPDAEKRVAQIDAYRLVLRGKATLEAVRPEVLERLQLMGLIRVEGGFARLRCPIYRLAFPDTWARDQLPAAELARQKRAAQRAGIRVATLAGLVSLGFLGLFLWGLQANRERDATLRLAQRQAYQSGMALVSQSAERQDYRRSASVADTLRGSPFVGWESRYWQGVFGQFRLLGNLGPALPAGQSRFHWFDGEVFYSLTEKGLFREGRLVDPAMALSAAILQDIRLGRVRNVSPAEVLRRLRRASKIQPGMRKTMGWTPLTFARVFGDPQDVVELYGEGGLVWRARVLERPVHRVVHDPLGRWVFVGSGHNLFQCLDAKTGRSLWSVRGEAGLFSPSPDGRWAVGRTFGGLPGRLLEAETGKVVHTLGDQPATFHTGDWSGNSERVALIGQDGLIQIWDPFVPRLVTTLVSPTLEPGSIYLSQSGRRIVLESGSVLYATEVGVLPSNQVTRLLPSEIQRVSWSPKADYGVATSISGEIAVVNAAGWRVLRTIPLGPVQDTHRVTFSPTGDRFIASSRETGAWLFDASGNQLQHLTPQANIMAHGFLNTGEAWLLALDRGAWIQPLGNGAIRPMGLPVAGASLLSRHPISGRWVMATQDGEAYVKSLDGAWIKVRPKDGTRPTSVSWNATGSLATLTTTAYDFLLIEFGRTPIVQSIKGHGARVWEAEFSPDGTRLLSTSWDGLALIHDIKTRRIIGRTIHGSWVPNAAWSPDGMRIVTASEDGRVRICDGYDGFEYTSFLLRPGFPFDVGFSPDGKTVWASDNRGNIHRWTAIPPQR